MHDSVFLFAVGIDQQGKRRELTWKDVEHNPGSLPFTWIHLQGLGDDVREWLTHTANIPPIAVQALLDPTVRPRYDRVDNGYLLILRSTSVLKPEDAESLASLRVWFTEGLVISVHRRAIQAVDAVRMQFLAVEQASAPAGIVLGLVRATVRPIGELVQVQIDGIDLLEDQILAPGSDPDVATVVELSRQSIHLRRHLGPLQAALTEMLDDPPAWWSDEDKGRCREALYKTRFYIEEIDLLRERAKISIEQIDTHVAQQLNKRLYIFSVIAAIFLPLTFITGLFGINLGGIPGAESPWGFATFSMIMTVTTVLLMYGLRKVRWI